MKCPSCGNQLKGMEVEDITTDVCEAGCAGVWFDNRELKKFDEPHESAGAALCDIARDESIIVDRTERRNCPKCDDIVMMRHFSSIKREVELDECPGCGGVWLDHGELEKLRGLFESEEHKNEVTDKHFAELYNAELEQTDIQSTLIATLPNLLKFLT